MQLSPAHSATKMDALKAEVKYGEASIAVRFTGLFSVAGLSIAISDSRRARCPARINLSCCSQVGACWRLLAPAGLPPRPLPRWLRNRRERRSVCRQLSMHAGRPRGCCAQGVPLGPCWERGCRALSPRPGPPPPAPPPPAAAGGAVAAGAA
jgi:hypothetical protein